MEFIPVCYKTKSTASNEIVSNSKQRLKKHSPVEQARWVALWQKSGMTQKLFCQQHGIDAKLFSGWKCKALKPQVDSRLSKVNTTERCRVANNTAMDRDQPPLVENNIQFQACIPNGVVLKFDALEATTAIRLIKGLFDAN